MQQTPDWRPIEAAPQPAQPVAPAGATSQLVRLLAVGLVACALLAGLAIVLWLASPQPNLVLAGAGDGSSPEATAAGSAADAAPSGTPAQVVVDVEGAVRAPGLHALPPGSRVGDAIAAAGGYAASADLEAAAQLLNLAALLNDGDKIVVPRLGASVDVPPPGSPATAATPAGGGLIDLNTADQATLETLPGIGPVTAAKIIAARTEAPFASVDELLGRGVVGAATFDKISTLVTVGP